MPTVMMSSGDGKMRGVIKRNGSEKKTVAEKMSGAVEIKKESDRKNAAALRSAIAWMKIGARKRSGILSVLRMSVLFWRRGDARKKNSATEIVGLIVRRCRRDKLRQFLRPERQM
jgi:hypothetical protein